MSRALVGVALQPGAAFWRHNRTLLEEQAELFEVTPETMWGAGCRPGASHQETLAFVRRCGRPVTAHGVLTAIGTATKPARQEAWLAALQRDCTAFGCQWISEHLGFTDAASLHVAWPLPLPPGEEAAAVAARALRELQRVHPVVAFENNADLFCLGDPLAQPALFARICELADSHLLLDLHNAWAFCRNTGADLAAWLDRLPWSRVIEIHLSGGSDSDPAFLPSGRSMRLDSHDGAVPEPVWQAFAGALPRAANLRAVVCEWFPDGMDAARAALFAADFARARSFLC